MTDRLPLTVLCVKFGTKYNIDYVVKLRNMVSRYLSVPYEFACYTDDPTPIPGVRLIVVSPMSYKKLWWSKVHMFDKKLPLSGRILYLDLDVVVCGDLEPLIPADRKKLFGIRDFNRAFRPSYNHLNSSVLSWVHLEHNYIYDKFKEDKKLAQRYPGDQDWIWAVAKNNIEFWPDDVILSYKWEIRSKSELVVENGYRNFSSISAVKPPSSCCVAVFHGEPKLEFVNDPFVLDNWK